MTPQEKLKEIIEDSGLSQPKFAKKIGISLHSIKDVIYGKQKSISPELAYALEQYSGISAKWWMTGEGNMDLQKQENQKLPENQEEFVKEKVKEKLDLTDKEYELIMRVLATDKQSGITALKAITGDETAKVQAKKLFNN